MNCTAKRPSAWLIATPLFPFLVAAWAGGAARRKSGSTWSEDCGSKRKEPASTRRKAGRARPAEDIIETALAAGSFKTLAKAVQVAGLVDTLKGEGPFTVFAPTDDAFDRLPKGALAALLKDKKKLASVLTFHVVPGRVEAAALESYAAMKTVQGNGLEVDTSIGVKVGSAYVVQADIQASNGVIHAIDSVLLPE